MNCFRLILIVGFLQNLELFSSFRDNSGLIFDDKCYKDEGKYDQMRRAFYAMNLFNLKLQQDKFEHPVIKNKLELLEYQYRNILAYIQVNCNEFDLFLKEADKEYCSSQNIKFERLFLQCCQDQAEIILEYRIICAQINIADRD